MAVKVGYQGNHGTFSEIAVLDYFKDRDIEQCGYTNFPDIMKDTENGTLDYALLPVENTTTGIIYRTYDLFKDYDVRAVGEITVPIVEDLIVIPGTKFEEIREVYTHPEVISQCHGFLQKNPQITAMAYQDTAAGVEYVKTCGDRSKAALGSHRAAEYFGMESLMKSVQDSNTNMTRFLCVTHKEEVPEDADKTSLMIVTKHEPGTLFRVLEVLAVHNINMLKLESRPIPGQIFRYCFYIDIAGSVNEPLISICLKEMEAKCESFRILGCYKADKLFEI